MTKTIGRHGEAGIRFMINNDEVFSYISLSNHLDIHYISLYSEEVKEIVLSIKMGDILRIKGLGDLRVAHVYSNRHLSETNSIWHEIGIACRKVE